MSSTESLGAPPPKSFWRPRARDRTQGRPGATRPTAECRPPHTRHMLAASHGLLFSPIAYMRGAGSRRVAPSPVRSACNLQARFQRQRRSQSMCSKETSPERRCWSGVSNDLDASGRLRTPLFAQPLAELWALAACQSLSGSSANLVGVRHARQVWHVSPCQ